MATFTQIMYHIVFSTKNRAEVLDEARREDLFRYTWGIVQNRNCHRYRINAVEDHVHILTGLHPTVALADFVKEIEVGTSSWIKDEGVFPNFRYWQEGYGAFTHSWSDKDRLIEYIKNQQEHHKGESFEDEYKRLLREAGISFKEEYLF